jgi:hypothetical protein
MRLSEYVARPNTELTPEALLGLCQRAQDVVGRVVVRAGILFHGEGWAKRTDDPVQHNHPADTNGGTRAEEHPDPTHTGGDIIEPIDADDPEI